jgi:hypothetical protein
MYGERPTLVLEQNAGHPLGQTAQRRAQSVESGGGGGVGLRIAACYQAAVTAATLRTVNSGDGASPGPQQAIQLGDSPATDNRERSTVPLRQTP